MRQRGSRLIVAAIIGAASLVGCATPRHSNTLIFGTNTKFALDASQDPTGMPSVTVGYKRQEAVWMPLLANTETPGKPAACGSDCLFQGKDTSGNVVDTYSVLASFGAEFSGKAIGQEGPQAAAGGALAQYFATGIAARILADKGGARLVSVQPGDVPQEIRDAAAKQITVEALAIEQIAGYVNADGKVDAAKLSKLIPGTGKDDKWVKVFAGQPVANLRKELDGPSRASIIPLSKNIPN